MSRNRITPKRSNGAGDSVTVYFDKTDTQERRALEAAQLLARKHGRRKDAIVALLAAMYDHYEQTGELLTATAIQNAISGVNVGRVPPSTFNPAPLIAPAVPAVVPPPPRETRTVEAAVSVSGSSVNPAEKWLKNMSNLFD